MTHTPGAFCTEPCKVCNDVPTTHTYWVSIGRNVDGVPMSEQDWHDFFAYVHGACLVWGDVITNVTGRSFWNGEDEDTRLILVSIDTDYGEGNLRHSLARLARTYRQDAIGFVGGPGTDTLIGGE